MSLFNTLPVGNNIKYKSAKIIRSGFCGNISVRIQPRTANRPKADKTKKCKVPNQQFVMAILVFSSYLLEEEEDVKSRVPATLDVVPGRLFFF